MSDNKYLDESEDETQMPLPTNLDETYKEISQYPPRNRPFACQVCNKRFTQKAHLIIHKRIHTGEKPYSCHICHRKFAQSSHLTVHKRVHTGEKPFFCNFCGIGFCRRPRLEAHILQHVVKEGKQLPSSLKGNMLKNLSMVGLENMDTPKLSVDYSSQLVEVNGGQSTDVKSEPLEAVENSNDILNEIIEIKNDTDPVRKRRKPEFVRKLGSYENQNCHMNGTDEVYLADDVSKDTHLLRLSSDDLVASSLSDKTETQRHIQPTSPKNSSALNGSIPNNSRQRHNSAAANSGLAISGLVRTNSRISLVDFSGEDILRHLMTRDDIKSCSFCCIVFHDPAMYYLHRSMHDKMDIRCCNLCGKLLADKYDFTAHFLNQHQ